MHDFDRETLVETLEAGHWQGTLAPAWNIGDNPNGGYMAACCTSALVQELPHPDPLSLTTHFLRPGVPGEPFQVYTEVVKTGRSMSMARASFWQSEQCRLQMLTTFGDLTQTVGVDTEVTVPPPELPPPEACPLRSGQAQGIDLPLLDRLEIRLHPEQAKAGEYPRMEVSGWIRASDSRAPDTRLLPVFADAFPPSPFAQLGVVGWVPTVELTVHVRRRPEPGWIRAQFLTEDLHHGRMVESGRLWDSAGNLVAQSRQLGLVMRAG